MKEFSFAEKMAYLASFIDAEGWVMCVRMGPTLKLHRRVGFTNTDKELFDMVVGFATEAGLEFRVHTRKSSNEKHSRRWDAQLVGGRAAYQKLIDMVPLCHGPKRQRLAEIMEEYCSVEEAKRRRAVSRQRNTTPEQRRAISKKALDARWTAHREMKNAAYQVSQ